MCNALKLERQRAARREIESKFRLKLEVREFPARRSSTRNSRRVSRR